MCFVIIIPALYAQDTGVTLRVLDTLRGSEVSIRSGPGIEYTEHLVSWGNLSLLVTGRSSFDPARTCLRQWTSDRDMWLRVQFNEIEGWVWRCHPYIEITGDLAVLPVVEPAYAVLTKDVRYPLIDGTNTPQSDFVLSAVVRYVSAVMREAPGLDAAVIGTIRFNSNVFVIGRTERAGWVKASYGDQVGWIASHLLGLPQGWQEFVPVNAQEP